MTYTFIFSQANSMAQFAGVIGLIIEAQAQAEMIRQRVKGEADAILMMIEAEAKGLYEILTKQTQGLKKIVKSAGNDPKDAVHLLIADKLPELVKTQSEAIKNIKLDKVTVWDGNGNNAEGKTSTANFIYGIYKAVPPLEDMFNMAGMQLPSYLKGEEKKENVKIPHNPTHKNPIKTEPIKKEVNPDEKSESFNLMN